MCKIWWCFEIEQMHRWIALKLSSKILKNRVLATSEWFTYCSPLVAKNIRDSLFFSTRSFSETSEWFACHIHHQWIPIFSINYCLDNKWMVHLSQSACHQASQRITIFVLNQGLGDKQMVLLSQLACQTPNLTQCWLFLLALSSVDFFFLLLVVNVSVKP